MTVNLRFRQASFGMRITDVAAASVLLWEVSARTAAVLRESLPEGVTDKFGNLDLSPPTVQVVEPGSVSVPLGGSTILAGVGLVIVAFVGGALVCLP